MSSCITSICEGMGNKVFALFFSSVVQPALAITNIYESVETLTVCTFVQKVELPALVSLFPILSRGLDVHVEVST